jgi:hypothetical protein
MSCRFLNATPIWIVPCFWAAPGVTRLQREIRGLEQIEMQSTIALVAG